MDLNHRNAVVTGGSRGIGSAIAAALASGGAGVVVTARGEADLERIEAQLPPAPGRVLTQVCDVSRPADVRALRDASLEAFGHVDILVNSAGISGAAPLAEIQIEDWNRMFQINATGTFLCTQAFVRGMEERGWGRVINIASTAGLAGDRYIAAYAASKHAVVGFTTSVAAEVSGTGVTVNVLCPGYVDTPMTRDTVANVSKRTGLDPDQTLSKILRNAGQSRLITATEVADRVLQLCEDEQDPVHGQAIEIVA